MRTLRSLRDRIAGDAGDSELLAYREGRSSGLPGDYRGLLKERLGSYAELGAEGVIPELEAAGGTAQTAPPRRPGCHSGEKVLVGCSG